MQTDALALAETMAQKGLTERLSWGVIELQVTDLNRAVSFWTMALGLHVHSHDEKKAELGTPSKTLFVLHAGATVGVSMPHLGMYHVAIGAPNQQEFSRIFARLIKAGVRVSPVDHLMAKSLYIADPDGLEIEVTFETPERFGKFGDPSKGLVMYTADGQQHSGRESLDARAELAMVAVGADTDALVTDDTFIAHMHFKVSDLDSAASWFEGLGFARNLMLPSFGFADLGAGAAHTHRLAMNIWAGPNLQPAPSNMARLVRYEIKMHDQSIIADATVLQRSGDGLSGQDPTGTQLSVIPAY